MSWVSTPSLASRLRLSSWVAGRVHLDEANSGRTEPEGAVVVAGADDHNLSRSAGCGLGDLGVEELGPPPYI
jgi:hypothetical protein